MLKSLFTKRNILITMAVAVMAVLCVFSADILTRNKSCYTPEKDSQVRIAWRIQTDGPAYLAIAPGDEYFCTVDEGSRINVYTMNGEHCYSALVDSMDRAVVSPDGAWTLAYKHLDVNKTQIVILDSEGRGFWKKEISGAVWSADACLDNGRTKFVVGTGTKCLYVFELKGKSKRYRWWRTPGVAVSLSIAPDAKSIIYATWQEAALVRCDFNGNKLWQRKLDSASLHYIEQLGSPNRLIIRSVPNRRSANGEFSMMDSDGVIKWKGILDAAADTRVLASADGRYIAIGFQKTIEHKGKSVCEKHVVLFDEDGARMWEKGSMFFQADPKLITCSGEAILGDSNGALFIMRRNGTLEGLGKMPDKIVKTVLSRDSKSLLLLCADKSLTKVEVSE